MAMLQSRRWCRFCQGYTLHGRRHFSFGVGCLATLITGLIFLPFWLLIGLVDSFRPWRCQACGGAYRISLFGRRKAQAPAAAPQVVIIHQPAAPRPGPAQPAPTPAKAPPPMSLPAPPEPPDDPPFDWAELRGRAVATVAGSYRSVVETYRALPEWAAPIVWGLGIAAPIVTTMVVIRTLL